MVVFVLGLPGSGKSYFASRLAGKLQAKYLNSDKILQEKVEIRTYSAAEKVAVYQAMFDQMPEAISKSQNKVIDATFHTENVRRLFLESIKDKKPQSLRLSPTLMLDCENIIVTGRLN